MTALENSVNSETVCTANRIWMQQQQFQVTDKHMNRQRLTDKEMDIAIA